MIAKVETTILLMLVLVLSAGAYFSRHLSCIHTEAFSRRLLQPPTERNLSLY